ncbi:MAG: 4Fe-4S binding protein [Coriobacteriales bacterium]
MSGPANIIDVLDDVASSCVAVNQTRCAKVRNRNVTCLKCAQACTSGCIALVGGELRIDASKCVGCGTCATVCPTCALEARNPTDAELLAECRRSTREGSVTIACKLLLQALGAMVDDGSCAQVVCAGRVDESLLVQLAADGCTQINIACGQCHMCRQAKGLETVQMVIENARALLQAWGSPCTLNIRFPPALLSEGTIVSDAKAAEEHFFSLLRGNAPVNPLSPEPALRHSSVGDDPNVPGTGSAQGDPNTAGSGELVVSARNQGGSESSAAFIGGGAPATAPSSLESIELEDAPAHRSEKPQSLTGEALEEALGTFFKKRVKVRTHSSLMKVMKDGTLPHFLPDRRERLLNALAQLGEPCADSLQTRLWGCMVIDATKCSSCQMCATFCPTGAIKKYHDEDGTFGVTHYPGDCVKCGSCRDICNEDAITLLDSVAPSYLLDGVVHRYIMRPRPVELGPHQMKDTMQQYMDIPIYER